ncbi:MAG: pseudouridine synthase [Coxiellaceae bacterium]|nr:pseudouridine synthase [Coxiellaceae bacterium]
MSKERIQKVLARTGLASRRKIEEWIKTGRVVVNGKPAEIGQSIGHKDQVEVDGELIECAFDHDRTRVLLYHKPEGQICTRDDPEGRETVFEHLPHLKSGRWISVGRLDINTSGVLLFTNDGDLANQLMHPSSTIEREYAVRILGEVTDDMANRLTQGIKLEDGKARFEHIVFQGGEGANRWYHVVTMEGRQRVVRRLFEAVELRVSRLIRVRFGPLALPSTLRTKRWLELTDENIEDLRLFLAADVE